MASQISRFDDIAAVSEAGAKEFVRISAESIAARGKFNVALSGGSTPKRMFELLAGPEYREQVDWANVHAFWSDERFVSPSNDQSNEHMARMALLDHVPIKAENIHGMYQDGSVENAAADYESLVRQKLGADLGFDLTLLGIGPDGHTASLFPGEPAVHENSKLVVAGIGHAGVSERITMTPPLLNRSKTVMFLVAGADKADPMHRVLNGPEDWDQTPAQSVARHARNILWLLDNVAAARLD